MENIVRNAFQRRGLDLHIAKLFALRREHGDGSFFERSGEIRRYARDYLRTWIPVWASDEERQTAQENCDAMRKSMGYIPEGDQRDGPEELLFREVLGILQEDYHRYYLGAGECDFSEAQNSELLDVYSLNYGPWQRTQEDKVAFDNVYFFNNPVI
jgi:hypothetical protein